MAPHLRSADLKDVAAAASTPITSLQRGYVYSDSCMTICDPNGLPIGMFGVVPLRVDGLSVGSVWLLGSDELVTHRWTFLRQSRYWLNQIGNRYSLLCNVVHAGNEVHIKWIRWLGFTCVQAKDQHGEPVIEFAKIINNV